MMINKFLVKDRKANRSRRMSCIAMCSLLLMAVCTAGASFTYGRYLQSESNTFSPQIAVMRTNVTTLNSTITLNNTNKLNATTAYFYVRNTQTEVPFSFFISLRLPEGETFPDCLSFELIEQSGNSITGVAEGNTVTFHQSYQFSLSNTSKSFQFQLRFSVNDVFAVPEEGITLENLQIVVHSEQIQEGA